GQGRRYDAPRHRSEVASGLDWRSAAAGGPRRAAVAGPEEGLRRRGPEKAGAPPLRAQNPPPRGGFYAVPLVARAPRRPAGRGDAGARGNDGCIEPINRIRWITPARRPP